MADQRPSSSPTTGSFDGNDHMSHFSNADYDWMGVLDGCFGHSDGHEIPVLGAINNVAAVDSNVANRANNAGNPSENLVNAAHILSTVASVDAAEEAEQLKTKEGDAEDDDGKKSHKDTDDEMCMKKSDRIERKRNREKQRRLDTNTQFTSLAAIVREIETTDFVEEAQFHSLYELTQQKGEGEASTDTDSNKRLKSDADFSGGESIQSAIATAGTYSASNRVELIARTTLMLSQFRTIRKKRNEELRDARRQNCEMKKEIEELRRMVAHYKTMGMGVQKPQDKIMMMVPMMVPQDAVNQVSAGFPAAHMMGGGGFASQWMPSPAMVHAMPSQTNNAPFAQLPGNQNTLNPAFQFTAQQPVGQSSGVASLPQHNMCFPFQFPGMVQNNANTSTNGNGSNPPSSGQSTPQISQTSTPNQFGVPSLNQGMFHTHPSFNQTTGMMFPHNTTGTSAVPNPMQNQTDNSTMQQADALSRQPSSDKPSPSTHQGGGGGNLAHCA